MMWTVSPEVGDPDNSIYRIEVLRSVQWSPSIGDPTLVGWLTVFAYVVAAWLCLRAFMTEKSGPPRPYRVAIAALLRVVRKHGRTLPPVARHASLWLVFALVMAFLGVNKQLDLQTLLTEIGRVSAYEHDWYEHRHTVQIVFVAVVGGTGLVFLGGVAWLVRDALRKFILALVGLTWLGVFVLIRASSFHHVDLLIHTEVLGIQLNWLFELSGIGLVAWGAAQRIRQAGHPIAWGWTPSKQTQPDNKSTFRVTQLSRDQKP